MFPWKLTSISLFSLLLSISTGCEDLDGALGSGGNNRDNRSSDVCSRSNRTSGDCEPYEAESRTGQSGCKVATNHSGYQGSGFIDFGGNGTWIEWNTITAPIAGEYTLTFRYANGGAGNRQAAIIVGGRKQVNVPFAKTGGWKNWRTATTKVALAQGNNTIRVQANTGSGGPNLDNMLVVGEGLVQDDCPDDPNKSEPGLCGCGVPEGSCGGGGNIALGKPTRQSSIAHRGESSRAVDGNTSGRWGDGSITHTDHTAAPWWRVDLGEAYRVDKVTLFNRTDCCSERLSDFHLDLLDQNDNVLATRDYPGRAGVKTDIPISAAGVYAVRVQLRGTSYLSLAEVQVSGSQDTGGTGMCAEAGENRTASLSCSIGEKITSIDFASYGLPTGTCDGGFQTGTCHASSTKSQVELSCLGKQSCTVTASNGKFGDPCAGKHKRIAITYRCSGGGNGDLCPGDPSKTAPGICGCGAPDTDSDGDGTPDCKDLCPSDPQKIVPGLCGCNVSDDSCDHLTVDRHNGAELRVGVYNVLRSSIFPKDNGDFGGKRARIEGFERVANAVDADIWAMQELMYGSSDQPGRSPNGLRRYMEKITGGTWYVTHHPDYQEFIFSRYPIDASGTPGRRIAWALIDVNDDNRRDNDVLVVSVHFMKDNHGQECANFVRDVIAGKNSKIPRDVTILVVGDFNNKPGDPRHVAIRSAIGVDDLRPVWLGTERDKKTTFTYGGINYSGGSFRAPSGGNPIDFIFPRVSNAYSVSKHFILSTLILDQSVLDDAGLERMDVAVDPAQAVSEGTRVHCDHFPLFVDLKPTR